MILDIFAHGLVLGGLGWLGGVALGLAINRFRGTDAEAAACTGQPDCPCGRHVPAEELLFDERAWERRFNAQEAVR
jgi:hypothetical protein